MCIYICIYTLSLPFSISSPISLCFRSMATDPEPSKPSQSEKTGFQTLFDAASNLLTSALSGGSTGSMPVAEGAVSDLFGRPLFFALFDWFIEVIRIPYG